MIAGPPCTTIFLAATSQIWFQNIGSISTPRASVSWREALPPFAAAWTTPLQRGRKRPSPATVQTPVA